MLIKIIKGNYGYHDRMSIRVKTPDDPPFSVSDDEALRLEKLGIAEILRETNDRENECGFPSDDSGENCGTEENAESAGNESKDDPKDYDDGKSGETNGTPEFSQESTNAELQAIASKWGIELPSRANKAQMLEILDGYFKDAPRLSAKEPE